MLSLLMLSLFDFFAFGVAEKKNTEMEDSFHKYGMDVDLDGYKEWAIRNNGAIIYKNKL